MNRLAQEAVLASLARRLDEQGSWNGETHIQKAAYLLHELTNVPFEFEFILYKHGPFSFELHDELASMRADRLLVRQPRTPDGSNPISSGRAASSGPTGDDASLTIATTLIRAPDEVVVRAGE